MTVDFSNADFDYDTDKDEKLKALRGIGFERIIALIQAGHVIEMVPYHNQTRRPGEWVMAVDVEGYAHLVPCYLEKDRVTMKTIYPSRKATKRYKQRMLH